MHLKTQKKARLTDCRAGRRVAAVGVIGRDRPLLLQIDFVAVSFCYLM